MEQEIWVASIDLEGILGMDFLKRLGCDVVPRDGQLELIFPVRKEKEVIEAHSDEVVSPRFCKVAVECTVSVPARGKVVVPGKVVGAGEGNWTALVEPSARFTHLSKLLVARTIVCTRKESVPLHILNPTD